MRDDRKKLKMAVAAAAMVMLTALCAAGCADRSAAANPPFETSPGGAYAGFDTVSEEYTPDEALTDGCMVVVDGGGSNSVLYGGESVFYDFLEACDSGDAAMRVAYFLDGGVFFGDLIYSGGKYYYIDSERPGDCTGFTKLRVLKTKGGIPERELTYYVITDSDELTADDVKWYYLSSDMSKITDIPFKWLGFTTYLTQAAQDVSADTGAAYNTSGAGKISKPDDFEKYLDITPEGVVSAKIYKNPETCDSVALIGGEYYQLGIGFGGFGLCDITEYGEYLIYTYSFGSGLHRSHVAALDMASGETVYTSEAFLNIDVMLGYMGEGVFGVYEAGLAIGSDFCDLTLTRGDKLAELTVSEDGFEMIGEPVSGDSAEELDAMISDICDNKEIAYSNNPYDYIEARREVFDELVAQGSYAAEYFIGVIRGSETFGLDKYVMAAVCAEITGVGAEGGWASAREWLELYDS